MCVATGRSIKVAKSVESKAEYQCMHMLSFTIKLQVYYSKQDYHGLEVIHKLIKNLCKISIFYDFFRRMV